ncbi:MAG: class I SAM-dependent methyltransferase [Candidatus Sumerlaeia bacterium]
MNPELNRLIEISRQGRLQEAKDAYEKYFLKFPDDYEARGHYAWLLMSLTKYEKALEVYDELVETHPDNDELYLRMAQAYSHLEQAEPALRLIQKCLRLNPHNKEAVECWLRLLERRESKTESPDYTVEAITNVPINPVISKLEAHPENFPGSVFPKVGRLLHFLVKCIQPSLAVEIGSYVGYSTICIAQAIKETSKGHLHAFDLFGEMYENAYSPILPESREQLEVVQAHLREADLQPYVSLHQGDSSTNVKEHFKGQKEILDFAFIDGDHRLRGCFKDWEATLGLIKPQGIIVLHDTNPDFCHWLGPYNLMEECKKYPDHFQVLNIPTPEMFGLGIIQKLGSDSPQRWNPSLMSLIKEGFLEISSKKN